MSFEASWSLISVESEIIKSNLSRSSHTANIINNKLYIFGGENQPRVPIDNNLLIFDIDQNKWQIHVTNSQNENKTDLPLSRLGHSSCSLENKLYIFGGRNSISMDDSSLNDLYEFDTSTSKWCKLESRNQNEPEKRSYHSMCALENKIYIFGGKKRRKNSLIIIFNFK